MNGLGGSSIRYSFKKQKGLFYFQVPQTQLSKTQNTDKQSWQGKALLEAKTEVAPLQFEA